MQILDSKIRGGSSITIQVTPLVRQDGEPQKIDHSLGGRSPKRVSLAHKVGYSFFVGSNLTSLDKCTGSFLNYVLFSRFALRLVH